MPSAYINAIAEVVLYLKPALAGVPLVTSPWASDVVTGVWNGAKQRYEFTVADGTEYLVYLRAGASPASSDEALGELLEIGTDTQQIVNGVLSGLSSIEPKVVSGYDARKRHIRITSGNDLSADNGTQIDVRVNLATGMDGENCTAYFGARGVNSDTAAIQTVVSVVKIGSYWYVRIELTSEQSAVEPGDYDWDALVVDQDSRKSTLVSGHMEVVKDIAQHLPLP